jgi:hypothetical protein
VDGVAPKSSGVLVAAVPVKAVLVAMIE